METPNNLNDRLKRFGKLIVTPPASSPSPTPEAPAIRKHPERYYKMAERLGGELVSNHSGTFCLIRSFQPFDYRHGAVCLNDTLAVTPFPVSAFTALEEEGSVDLREIIYFDTETTGLGGAGIVPFLIGCGAVVEGGFEVRQYLIPDYSDEAAMLEAVLDELTPQTRLVTYNGAAFDVPILRDRYIINRVARAVNVAHHIDLLHPTRRLFKRRVKECNLTHIEKHLFDFRRDDDIPGYLVPSVYFEWLHAESLDRMVDVLRHNCWDIVSLHFLLWHIARAFESEGRILDRTDDIYSLSRVYRRRKRNETVLTLCDRIAAEGGVEITPEMLLFHAAALKRAGEWDRAAAIWRQLANRDSREGYRACIELAVYFEHRIKEPNEAMQYTRRAETICPYGRSEKLRLAQRLARLHRKNSSTTEV